MGIPHLTANLKPYASIINLTPPTSHDHDEHSRLVIDGPAFAYYIYEEYLRERTKASDLTEALPSYERIGDAAIGWLHRVRAYGLTVSQTHTADSERIFFDGLLPKSKEPERLRRLQSATKKVAIARMSEEMGPWFIRGFRFTEGEEKVNLSKIRNKLRDLPPPAFLAPAILEALRSTDFGSYTSVVPGEADIYCADYVRNHGGIILTNDSDLLVHDLGANGSVIFLNDVRLSAENEYGPLKSLQFHPRKIAKGLGLKNIIQLAYVIENKQSFSKSLQLAKSVSTDSPEYIHFSTQFNSLLSHSKLLDDVLSGDPHLMNVLQWLDVRVSEFAHQCTGELLMSPSGELAPVELGNTRQMYLPVLLEDSGKATAWVSGTEMRSFGYSLLSVNTPGQPVEEVRRRGNGVVTVSVTVLGLQDLKQSLAILLRDLDEHVQKYTGHESVDVHQAWQIFGVKTLCKALLETGKPVPPKSEMSRLLRFQHSLLDSWAWVHLQAQLQAALYSLRTLKEFIDVFLAAVPAASQDQDLMQIVRRLKERFVTYPLLQHLFKSHVDGSEEQRKESEAAVEDLYKSLGVEEVAETSDISKKERKRMKKMAEEQSTAKEDPAHKRRAQPTNIFSILAE
ncbi:MAG: hypothetical protein Q9165_003000 [Trypethelium subeluteriae]